MTALPLANASTTESAHLPPKIVQQIDFAFEQLGVRELMELPGVTEVAINEPNMVWYEQNSTWKSVEKPQNKSNSLIAGLGTLLINSDGKSQEYNENNPMLSLTMPNGARAQLVRKPAAENASLTVRIPSKNKFTMDEYEKQGLFDAIIPNAGEISPEDKELEALLKAKEYRRFLEAAIAYRKNIVVSGATGSGKTTFMKTLIDLIDYKERIITIEDARELFIDQPNKVHLMYPKSISQSTVTAKSCLEATLRMKPDRIILAEVRGDEAFYFIRACGNGHSGSITSCHADSALMAYEQLALMINASPEGAGLSHEVIKRLIMMTIDISIHFANHSGKRYITAIDFQPTRKFKLLKEEI